MILFYPELYGPGSSLSGILCNSTHTPVLGFHDLGTYRPFQGPLQGRELRLRFTILNPATLMGIPR